MGFVTICYNNWMVVSTHLKNISQNGNLPQIGVKIKNIWNHHLDNHFGFHKRFFFRSQETSSISRQQWAPLEASTGSMKPHPHSHIKGVVAISPNRKWLPEFFWMTCFFCEIVSRLVVPWKFLTSKATKWGLNIWAVLVDAQWTFCWDPRAYCAVLCRISANKVSTPWLSSSKHRWHVSKEALKTANLKKIIP